MERIIAVLRKNIWTEIFDYLKKVKLLYFILIFYFLIFFLDIIISLLVVKPGSVFHERMITLRYFILAVFVAPILETLIYQGLIIKITRWILGLIKIPYMIIPMIISAVCFGLVHNMENGHYIVAIVIGFILAFAYCVLIHRRESSFLWVCVLHSLINLTIFSLRFFFAE